MKLIDADALIKWINKARCADCPDKKDDRCGACQWDDVIMSIETAPTVATDTNVLGKWISVKDRLPEDDNVVIGIASGYSQERRHFWDSAPMIVRRNRDEWKACDVATAHIEVTHWMPIPEPPEEVSGDG